MQGLATAAGERVEKLWCEWTVDYKFYFCFMVCLKLHFLLCVLSAVCVHDTLINRDDAAQKHIQEVTIFYCNLHPVLLKLLN